MKTILFFLMFTYSLTSFSAEKMDMACITEFPSTSFVVREVDDTIILEVFNHNGLTTMPIYNGIVTPFDLAGLTEKAKVLTQLNTIQRFEWPKTKCKKQDSMVEACIGSTSEQSQNGHIIKAWAFTTSQVTEKTFDGVYTEYKFSLDVNVDGKSYTIPMKYSESECYPDSIMSEKLTNKVLR